jgi:hypothetical protein
MTLRELLWRPQVSGYPNDRCSGLQRSHLSVAPGGSQGYGAFFFVDFRPVGADHPRVLEDQHTEVSNSKLGVWRGATGDYRQEDAVNLALIEAGRVEKLCDEQ